MSKAIEVTNNESVSIKTVGGCRALWSIGDQLSKSDIIPTAFQGKPANCMIALNMANRLNADPMMVMQNLYIVHGNPSWSSKFLIATFNGCGKYTSIKYKMVGENGKDTYGCIAYATEKETGNIVTGPMVTIGMAKAEGWMGKNGSKWKTMPELMLRYRAATLLVRTVAPELSMGLHTVDEMEDIEMAETAPNTYTAAVEDLKEEVETSKMENVTPAAPPTAAKDEQDPRNLF